MTTSDPFTGRVCGGISAPVRITDVAFVVLQERVTGAPAAAEVAGVAVNLR